MVGGNLICHITSPGPQFDCFNSSPALRRFSRIARRNMRFANEPAFRPMGCFDSGRRCLAPQISEASGPVATPVTRQVNGATAGFEPTSSRYGSLGRSRRRYVGNSSSRYQHLGEHHLGLDLAVDKNEGQLAAAHRRGTLFSQRSSLRAST